MNLKQAAWFSAVPWATMAVSGYVAGAVSDFLIKAGYSITFVRKVMQVIHAAYSIRIEPYFLSNFKHIYNIVALV